MALIRKAGAEAKLGEGSLGGEHSFASGADAEAMDVLADAFANAAAKNAGKVDGMDASLVSKFVEGEAAAVLALNFVENA